MGYDIFWSGELFFDKPLTAEQVAELRAIVNGTSAVPQAPSLYTFLDGHTWTDALEAQRRWVAEHPEAIGTDASC